MGILRESLKAIMPSRGEAVSATIPVGTDGVPQQPDYSYERYAREGYGQNALVYACVEMLATSAAEPKLCAYDADGGKIDDHPFIELWNNPNPWLDRFTIGATIVMYRSIAGNAYVEKVRSAAGKITELWLPRPDRVFVIPDNRRFIRGYQYQIGADTFEWPEEDIVHLRTRNPLANNASDFYGLPPLAAIAGNVDIENYSRDFVKAFFTNAGVPAGLLNVMKSVNEQERDMIRRGYQQQYGGKTGWHRLLVIDGGQASYSQMGMPFGESGAGLESINKTTESRICGAFGVFPSLVATVLGLESGSYANRQSDKENFWELTLAPIYREIAEQLTLGFRDEYPGTFAYLGFDMDDVRALSEDADKLSARVLAQLEKGAISLREARTKLGYDEDPKPDEIFLVQSSAIPTTWKDLMNPEPPALPEPPAGVDQAAAEQDPAYADVSPPAPNGNGRPLNGRAAVRG